MYLGIKAVIAKSYARIHRQNLINAGIVPLLFKNAADYDNLKFGDELKFAGLLNMKAGEDMKIVTENGEFAVKNDLTEKEIGILKNGGLLNTIREELKK